MGRFFGFAEEGEGEIWAGRGISNRRRIWMYWSMRNVPMGRSLVHTERLASRREEA
jgi:hypothetical protein